jgi:hypothetical protein
MKSPYPPRAEQECANCFYVKLFDKEITVDGSDHYECRRRAPVAVTGLQASYHNYWPGVHPYDWCGEWAPQEVPA